MYGNLDLIGEILFGTGGIQFSLTIKLVLLLLNVSLI